RARTLGAQHPVDDRHQVRQALARPGSGRQHVAIAAAGHLDRFPLMLVQPQGLRAGVAAVPLDPEDPLALGIEGAAGHQLVDATTRREVRIERQPRVRPLVPESGQPGYMRSDPVISDVYEARRELAVVRDELIAHTKDVHAGPLTGE